MPSCRPRPFALLRREGTYVVTLRVGKRTLERALPTRGEAISLVAYLAGRDRLGALVVADLAFNGDLFTGGRL